MLVVGSHKKKGFDIMSYGTDFPPFYDEDYVPIDKPKNDDKN